MYDDTAIRFREVTKTYSLAGLTSAGIKNLILHWPTYVRDLRRKKRFRALDHVSFDIRKGECFGVIGRNGSGKSTTLGLIAGVLKPTEGVIETQGRIAPLLELGAGFHPELSGRENIILNGILLGMTRRQVMEQMEEILAFSELGEFAQRPIRVYSSGMVARLGFSVAVHLEPDILLVDEVLSVGDEAFQEKCLAKMEAFRADGVTMVFVSHDLKDVERICDRVALLDAGRMLDMGEPRRVVAEYKRHVASRTEEKA